MGIAGINEALRNGEPIRFVTDLHRDGPGWGCDLDLPHGVTAGMILARREQLASGLRRPLSATWPERAARARGQAPAVGRLPGHVQGQAARLAAGQVRAG